MNLGITAGFGSPLGADLLRQIKAYGFSIVRIGDFNADADRLSVLTQEVVDAGLRPVILCTAAQLEMIPAVCQDVEVYDAAHRSEPLFYVSPQMYADALNRVASIVRLRGLRAWVGALGTSAKDLRTLAVFVKTLDPVYGISVHRYPPAGATTWNASVNGTRDYEVQRLTSTIGSRPFAVLEWGYSQCPVRHWYWFGWHPLSAHLTDLQQRDCLVGEAQFWASHGAAFSVLFQLNDGPTRCVRHQAFPDRRNRQIDEGFGVRAWNGSWKVAAVSLAGLTGPTHFTPKNGSDLGFHAGSNGE